MATQDRSAALSHKERKGKIYLKSFRLISDEFAEISMEFEILRDSGITGNRLSQFMKVVQAL